MIVVKRAFYILTLGALMGLVSCVSQGNVNATDATKLQALKKGASTKQDVWSAFGQPHDVRQVSPGSRWSYYHTKSTPNAAGFIPVAGLFLPDSNITASISHLYFDKRSLYTTSTTKQFTDQQNAFASIARGVKSFSSDTQQHRVKAEMKKLGVPFNKKEATKVKDMGTILGANPEL